MTDSVEVRPRYTEPGASRVEQSGLSDHSDNSEQSTVSPAQSPAPNVGVTARGLFTSMYENKIIVLIIVVVILIIGIIAYIVLRKPDETSEQSKQKIAGANPPAETPSVASASTPASEPATTPAPKPQTRMDKSNLVNLLAKSKNASVKSVQPETTQPTTPEQAPADENTEPEPNPGAKTEDEIMQLMEDEPVDDNSVDAASSDQTETTPLEQPAECDVSDITASESQDTPVTKTQSIFCTAMLPIGRQCRNKAGNGGRCRGHQGGN